MTRFLMVGDVHGDGMFARRMVDTAAREEVDMIIQMGDFGIWDHAPDGVKFLDKLDQYSAKQDVTWLFVAGNHENYDSLERYESNKQHTLNGFVPIRDNILWTKRVNTWNWDGLQWAAVGGAYSIDKVYRVPGKSWWPQEQLTWADVDKVASWPDAADILITHDCPDWARFNGRLKPDETSVQHRKVMSAVHQELQPKVWFHGHYHSWMDYYDHGTQVYGLECNDDAMWDRLGRRPVNHVIFDTEDFSIKNPDRRNGAVGIP